MNGVIALFVQLILLFMNILNFGPAHLLTQRVYDSFVARFVEFRRVTI